MKFYFLVLLLLLFLAPTTFAAESQFGFVYTTDLLPKGEKEVEQWTTWRSQKIAGTFNLLEGRTAIEYGVTDQFQIAFYASYDWTDAYENGPFGATTPPEQFSYDVPGPSDFYAATRFIGVSVEGIYRLLSPYTDFVGLAFYLEPTLGNEFFEVESKIILQKNFFDDTLILGVNFTYAPEYRLITPDSTGVGPVWQEETDLNTSLGASYRFAPSWFAGFEFENEREFNDYGFSRATNSGYFIGPSVHYGAKSFFLTAVFLTQMPWSTVYAETTPGAVVGGYNYDVDFEKYMLRIKLGIYL